MNHYRGAVRKLIYSLVVSVALGCSLFAATASANIQFEGANISLKEGDGSISRQAGAHPDFTFKFDFAESPPESVRTVDLDLPKGMIGNPTPFDTCTPATLVGNSFNNNQLCPVASQVGIIELRLVGEGPVLLPVYNLTHGSEVPARFGFKYLQFSATITPRIRPQDLGISSGSFEISQARQVLGATLTLWGNPSDHSHDCLRAQPDTVLSIHPLVCELVPSFEIADPAPELPFFTNPTACPDAVSGFTARADSYQDPGVFDEQEVNSDPEGNAFVWQGCENSPFEPTLTPVPGTHRAASPTGLDVAIDLPSNEGPDGFSSSAVKKTVIDFPQGMTVSPSAVAGLEACSLAQIGLGSNEPPSCPNGSKIGNATIETQVLPDPLEGDVFLARQKENPFGSTYALYLAVKGPGFYLKLPGELELNKNNGQLRVVFDDLPELPFESVHLDLRGGPTAPLVTPNVCGNYSIRTEVTPWARPNQPVVASVPMKIDENCAGGGGFNPGFQAGVANPVAGAKSPLNVLVSRSDGEQNLSQISVTLPEGELASLRGVTPCPDSLAPTGACPASSQVGIATTSIGTGVFPLVVPQPGKEPTALYLAGPYKGAPYSLVTKAPAQAGPFDFGVIVVRTAISLNPLTAQVTASSDPLPQILEGVPLAYREVNIEVQKPDFTVNPTSCEQRYVTTTLTSVGGAQTHPQVPFKVGDCASLNFKPKLALKLKGGTHRGDFPQLTAVLTTGAKESNIAKVSTTLPHSEFLEQGHIGTVCTRVQYAAKACPAASIYGYAKAITPLLDQPLEGPVYLRSSNHTLPDLVAELNGQFDVELVGRIDSHNQGIRTTFETVPDAPVSKFVLTFKSGKKSLLVNSRNLCKAPAHATIRMFGQNGMRHDEQPLLETGCGKKSTKKKAK